MYETRQQRRRRQAEARRAVYANWTGPTRRISDLVPDDARVNRQPGDTSQ